MNHGDLRFRLLGPLEVRSSGGVVPLTGRQRALCAALALDLGRVVPADRLVERIWADRPPAAPAARLRSLVADLRRAFGPADAEAVVTRSPGYQLCASPDVVDLLVFEDTFATASRAAAQQNWTKALELFDQALGLWGGDPLPDLPRAPERQRLLELRIAAEEGRWEAAAALGETGGAIAELTRLAGEHPLRERPHALLMDALGGAGRTAEALDVYTAVRRRLVEELGVEPTAELVEAQRRLLSGEPPGNAAAPSARAAPPIPIPRQLPSPTQGFVGRGRELRLLDAAARRGDSLVVVTGEAGAGKTALALQWAARAAARFPDGQLFLDMRGFDAAGPMTVREALPLLLQGLGCESARIPVDESAQAALYRTLLAGRRVLLVLDDVAGAAQVRPLLPGTDTSLVVATSRDHLSGLVTMNGAHRVACGVLDREDAVGLLSRTLGADRVAAEPGAAARLAGFCDHLPLALCVAAARIVEDEAPDAIARYVEELTDRGRLARLRLDGDESVGVRSALDLSYAVLPEPVRRVFRGLGAVPGTGRSVAAAAATAGLGLRETADALRNAARVHLVRAAGDRGYAWHDLVHEYAAQRLLEEDGAPGRDAAVRRTFDHYLRTVSEALSVVGLRMLSLPGAGAEAGPAGGTFSDRAAAYAWFDREWEDIAAVIAHIADRVPVRPAWQLVTAAQDLLQHRRPPAEWMRVAEQALRAAERDGDLAGRAAMRLSLAAAYWRAADLPAALAHYRQAERLARAAGWTHAEGVALQGIGVATKQSGRPREALGYYRKALALFRRVPHRADSAAALSNTGSAHIALGELREAERALMAARPLAEGTNPHFRSLVLVNLGLVLQEQGRLAEALDMLGEAIEAAAQTGSAYARAVALETLGLVRAEAGRTDEAAEAYGEALDLAREVENKNCQTACLIGLSAVARARARYDEAATWLDDARTIADLTDAVMGRIGVLLGEAELDVARGAPADALAHVARAEELAAEAGPFVLPRVRLLRTRALARTGDHERAAAAGAQACRLAEACGQHMVHSRALDELAAARAALDDPAGARAARERAAAIRAALSPEAAARGSTPRSRTPDDPCGPGPRTAGDAR
ncbi:BTAD domain-containing putative transcriptional regulator [Streptomyces sp. SID9124]|uniref:BTAD domain-containing putative transcriptional regulator n=1 Tax=Streptomyces sp. SID9124 TaxID=2706108 RepID=UPI0013DEBFC1|nr:tetratricopeptide repeat protein [Streptomyces sp. SID9124]